MKRKYLKDLMDSVMQVIKAAKNTIVSKAELSAEEDKQEKELLQKQADAALKEFVRYDLMPNYKAVANAVYKCLIENHSQCGLCRPNDIEGVIYSDLGRAIDTDPAISKISGVIFRFEAIKWRGATPPPSVPDKLTEAEKAAQYERLYFDFGNAICHKWHRQGYK